MGWGLFAVFARLRNRYVTVKSTVLYRCSYLSLRICSKRLIANAQAGITSPVQYRWLHCNIPICCNTAHDHAPWWEALSNHRNCNLPVIKYRCPYCAVCWKSTNVFMSIFKESAYMFDHTVTSSRCYRRSYRKILAAPFTINAQYNIQEILIKGEGDWEHPIEESHFVSLISKENKCRNLYFRSNALWR